jgi:hypothetical protein
LKRIFFFFMSWLGSSFGRPSQPPTPEDTWAPPDHLPPRIDGHSRHVLACVPPPVTTGAPPPPHHSPPAPRPIPSEMAVSTTNMAHYHRCSFPSDARPPRSTSNPIKGHPGIPSSNRSSPLLLAPFLILERPAPKLSPPPPSLLMRSHSAAF